MTMKNNNTPHLEIGTLHMQVQNATGHEHRLQPIAQRAASLFATRLGQRAAQPARGSLTAARLASLTAAPLHIDLHTMSNEQAAGAVASAWLDAVGQRLRI